MHSLFIEGHKDLKKAGHKHDKQRYCCRTCGRISYGLPPDRRPKCPKCKGGVRATRLPDGRMRYLCLACRFCFRSEYVHARPEKLKGQGRHMYSFSLNRTARQRLFEYVQAVRCTDPQAIRAIFRHVLTGKVLWTICGTSPRSRLLTRIARDPAVAATRFPDLRPENLRRMTRCNGIPVKRFRATVQAVHKITVRLDDAAKEGLAHTMRHLGMNHADAARWLLSSAEIPSSPATPVPVR